MQEPVPRYCIANISSLRTGWTRKQHRRERRVTGKSGIASFNIYRINKFHYCIILKYRGRRWGKRLSLVVVYLDRPVVVRGNSVWFRVALHPVERYVFVR